MPLPGEPAQQFLCKIGKMAFPFPAFMSGQSYFASYSRENSDSRGTPLQNLAPRLSTERQRRNGYRQSTLPDLGDRICEDIENGKYVTIAALKENVLTCVVTNVSSAPIPSLKATPGNIACGIARNATTYFITVVLRLGKVSIEVLSKVFEMFWLSLG